jgi:hypothetical protein
LIDHARLLTIMSDLGYPQDAINLIGNIYSNSTTIFTETHFGKTDPVHIQLGTTQGDKLSPYLFIISLEPLLRWLERGSYGYNLKTSNCTLNSAAYADNLVILVNKLESLQPQINKIDRFCQWASMDLGITRCAITGRPNNQYMPPQTFKGYIQTKNITYRNQPIPVLHQDEPYTYLGINLVPSLKWTIEKNTTMRKLNKQTQQLLQSPATLKQKIKMVDTVIRAGIAYSFYASPYSMPDILKLDRKLIAFQKAICGLPKSTPNITTQLSHELFGINAFSLKIAYLTCIGEQLQNALNDPERLEKIYQGLTNYIFTKHGGAELLDTLTKKACKNSSKARTLYLLKHKEEAYIKSFHENHHIGKPPLAKIWFEKAMQHQRLLIELSHKYLNILLLSNITTFEQITLPNKTTIIQNEDFKKFHQKPTPTIKKILKIAAEMFCSTNYNNTCRLPCNIHLHTYTLTPDIANKINQNFTHNPIIENTIPENTPELPKPPKEMMNLQNYPITSITNKKTYEKKDKYENIKKFTSYKCEWELPNNQEFATWISTDKLFPHNNNNISTYNLTKLTQFYHSKQQEKYQNIMNKNFYHSQNKDTRHIHEPLYLPLVQIQLYESNPDTDIQTDYPTIQIIKEEAHIYSQEGNSVIIISKKRLEWLWKQYNKHIQQTYPLEPQRQSFEQELIWLYKRYKYKKPKTDPLKQTQYTMLDKILQLLIETFNITTSYFSSLVTCPIQIT